MSAQIESSSIPVDAYLKYALTLTERETELIKEFSKWLPSKIIDAHAHSNTQNQCCFIDDYYLVRAPSTFPWFETKRHQKVNKIFYPTNEVKMLLFPNPFRGINHRAVNNYIVRQATKNPWIVPVLYGIPDDTEYTISKLKTGRFHGLKMFRGYFFPPIEKISGYFPDPILKFCNEVDIPIILHLPSNVIESREELITIVRKFSDLKIVLAHTGSVFLPIKNFKRTFAIISKCRNIYLDTAMVTSEKVVETALDAFGPHRILFGTDQPANLIRGKMYNSISGVKIATSYQYHWITPEEIKKFARYAKGSIHFHWEILLALQKAIQSYGENRDIKNCIFRKNAERVFGLR